MALVLVEGEGRLPALLDSAGVTRLEHSTDVPSSTSATATQSSSARALAPGLTLLKASVFLAFSVSLV